ncbi:SDR family NAD(P)-dependent oxidoreductase [Agrobacterium leguminum]|uniref:SDR family NAD(P)-dependent oxidoreductase n=1 Tax=Agrobacterium leguminum TaxID=2792015 RepID=UPI0030B819C5
MNQHDFRLDGKVALITGASGGIGEQIALSFASAGASVILSARTLSSLNEVARRIEMESGQVPIVWECDVTNAADMQQRIAATNGIDILVNNAGTNIPKPFIETSESDLDAVCNLNIRSTFLVTQAAVRKMLQDPDRARKASVIFITSQMGHVGSPDRSAYCMSKHALEGLTKALAVEIAPHGIRVNSIAPTFVDTPLVRRIVDTQEKKDYLFSKIPMGQLASVDDIAAAALFLGSSAAAMITGTSLRVDGGWTAQ